MAGSGPAMTSDTSSEAQIRHHVAALVLDHIGTADALERLLGIFVAEGGGSLIIAFCGGRILWSAAALGSERAHALQRTRMVLRSGLFEQFARRGVILCAAGALRQHQAELILRLRVGFSGPAEQFPRTRGIGRRAAAAERGEITDAARIARFSRALEQFSRLRLVPRHRVAGAVEHAEIDHRRGRALVGGLAPGYDCFR